MKKAKIFFSGFLPLIVTTALQYGAVIMMLLVTVIIMTSGEAAGLSGASIYKKIIDIESSGDYQSLIMILYTIMGIVIFSLWYCLRCGGSLGVHRYPINRPLRLAGLIILVPGLQFAAGIICSIIDMAAPSLMEEYEELLEMAGLSEEPTVILLLYSVILAPICEELIFRGVTMRIFRRLSRRFFFANFMQALLFGIFHGNWVQGIYTFVIGLAFGYICEYGGSIWDSIILHMLFNFWGTVITDYLSYLPEVLIVDIIIYLSIPVSLAVGAYLFFLSDRNMLFRGKHITDN